MLLRHRRTSHVSLTLQSSSFSSITDSTMSLNIITVTLNMGEWEVCMDLQSFQSDTGSWRGNWGGGKENAWGRSEKMDSVEDWLLL